VRHWIVPFGRNKEFVGRETILADLLARISPSRDEHDCQRTVIEGLGGVGKTQIALEAAFRVGKHSCHPSHAYSNNARSSSSLGKPLPGCVICQNVTIREEPTFTGREKPARRTEIRRWGNHERGVRLHWPFRRLYLYREPFWRPYFRAPFLYALEAH
jgi:hypothetical protein